MNINWSKFDQFPESTCWCRCGDMTWRSHVKAVKEKKAFVMIARKPCPACGSNRDLRGARSDPEEYVLVEKKKQRKEKRKNMKNNTLAANEGLGARGKPKVSLGFTLTVSAIATAMFFFSTTITCIDAAKSRRARWVF